MNIRCWLLVASAALAAPAGAQTMYKCVVAGKTTYSGTPCTSGAEVKRIAPDAAPTAEDQWRARARVQAEQDHFDAKEQGNPDSRAARTAASRQRASPPAPDNSLDEKVTTSSASGWDRKAKGQLEMENAVRNGGAGTSTGAKWESEKVMVQTPIGWQKMTRAEAARREGQRLRARDARAAAPAPSTLVDQFGHSWQNHGGTAFDPVTGQTCTHAGGVLVNCN